MRAHVSPGHVGILSSTEIEHTQKICISLAALTLSEADSSMISSGGGLMSLHMTLYCGCWNMSETR